MEHFNLLQTIGQILTQQKPQIRGKKNELQHGLAEAHMNHS